MKEDSLTASVARLHRAGSEHSQQTQKLREAVNNLIAWLKENDLQGRPLPCNCRVYSSGEFVQFLGSSTGTEERVFGIMRGKEHSLTELLAFSKIIADGFLEQLSKELEFEAEQLKKASEAVMLHTNKV